MGFKMKGSAFKQGNVATKSALKQMEFEGEEKIDDKYLPSDLATTEVARSGDMFKKKGKHLSSTGEARWIRNKYGRNLSKKELRNARMAYYDLIKGSSSGDPYTEESTTEIPTTEIPKKTSVVTEIPTRKKGYFTSEFSQKGAVPSRDIHETRTSSGLNPSDYGTLEEYEAAVNALK